MSFSFDSWPVKIGLVAALLVIRTVLWAASRPSGNSRVQRDTSGTQGWLETVDSAALAISLVFFVIQPFLVQAFYIPSGSMQNTLRDLPVGDRLLVSKLVYRLRDPQRGEIVVFDAPEPATKGTDTPAGSEFIKRAIGTPGDVLEAKYGRYFLNGKLLNEPYVKWSAVPPGYYDMKIVDGQVYHREYDQSERRTPWLLSNAARPDQWQAAPDQDKIENAKPGAVPAGQYLMLGDHRDHSSDGHIWGFVPRANIVGKAMVIFWPLNRITFIDRIKQQPQITATPQPVR
jgi:signal peptidase I